MEQPKKHYLSPQISIMEIEANQGFFAIFQEGSGDVGITPGLEDGGDDWGDDV